LLNATSQALKYEENGGAHAAMEIHL